MQDYREIDRMRKDCVAVRSLAKRLLELPHADWNDWERDDAKYYSSVHGFSVQSLLKNCWIVRDDLSHEEDKKFIEDLKVTSCLSVKRRQLRKLLACARELEEYVSIDG